MDREEPLDPLDRNGWEQPETGDRKMSEYEYVGQQVSVIISMSSKIPVDDIAAQGSWELHRLCAAKGLQATDITLAWHGSWAEAIARGTIDAPYSDCTVDDDLMVYLYEATACESVSA